jgi:hypothetical protein
MAISIAGLAVSDFTVTNHRSICVLTPISPAAVEWVAKHASDDANQTSVVVAPRHLADILHGIRSDGLVVAE